MRRTRILGWVVATAGLAACGGKQSSGPASLITFGAVVDNCTSLNWDTSTPPTSCPKQ